MRYHFEEFSVYSYLLFIRSVEHVMYSGIDIDEPVIIQGQVRRCIGVCLRLHMEKLKMKICIYALNLVNFGAHLFSENYRDRSF